MEIDKLDLRIGIQRVKNSHTILQKKNKAERLSLSDVKTEYKATAIKKM